MTTNKVSTSITIDPQVKREATIVFKSLGLDFSSGIDIYLRVVAREQRIPFDLDLNKKVDSSD